MQFQASFNVFHVNHLNDISEKKEQLPFSFRSSFQSGSWRANDNLLLLKYPTAAVAVLLRDCYFRRHPFLHKVNLNVWTVGKCFHFSQVFVSRSSKACANKTVNYNTKKKS